MAHEWDFYKEHVEHGRHVEVQRSTIAGVAATVAGAIIGELIKKPRLTREDLTYTVALMSVGLVALLLTAKLYERFKLHNAIAREARNAVDPSLGTLRSNAERLHKARFKFLYKLRLHVVWNSLFALISLIGIVATVIAWRGGWPAQ